MIGISKGSLHGAETLGAAAAIEAAAREGWSGILFNSILELSPTLDLGELADLKAKAAGLQIDLAAGCGWISAGYPERLAPLAKLGGGDFLKGLEKAVRAAKSIGLPNMFFVNGLIEERDNLDRPWADELVAEAKLLASAAPMLRDLDFQVLIKTHEEIHTSEILRIVETVGEDVLGVSLDPVNVLCRIEDPIEAAKRVAPYVKLIHVEDAILQFETGGIRRYLAPLGEGVIDWASIFAMFPGVPSFLELHRGQFAMPVFDRAWVARQPDVTLDEFVAVLGFAANDRTGPMPWDQAAPWTRIDAGKAFLAGIGGIGAAA